MTRSMTRASGSVDRLTVDIDRKHPTVLIGEILSFCKLYRVKAVLQKVGLVFLVQCILIRGIA
jgi:hypothetical protein